MIEASDPLWVDKPFDRWRARLDLLAAAAYAPYSKQVAGRMIPLQRGELVASGAYLANRWGWAAGQVRGFVALIVSENFMAAVRRTSVGTVYEILDYDVWDGDNHAPRRPARPGPGLPPGEGASDELRKAWELKVLERAAAELPAIPQALRTAAFETAWRERLIERAEKLSRGKLTRTQVVGQFKELLRVAQMASVEQAVRLVEQATRGGYGAVGFTNDEAPPDNGQLRQASLFDPLEGPVKPGHEEGRQSIPSPEWTKIRIQLREAMEYEEFITYISPLKAVAFENGELTLQAPNLSFVAVLTDGFKGVLDEAASGIARLRLIAAAKDVE